MRCAIMNIPSLTSFSAQVLARLRRLRSALDKSGVATAALNALINQATEVNDFLDERDNNGRSGR